MKCNACRIDVPVRLYCRTGIGIGPKHRLVNGELNMPAVKFPILVPRCANCQREIAPGQSVIIDGFNKRSFMRAWKAQWNRNSHLVKLGPIRQSTFSLAGDAND